MQCRCVVAVVILSAGMLAQTSPAPCPAERPVDEIVSELKKNSRNKNPLPDVVCVFGWCGRTGKTTPPTVPQPSPRAETAAAPTTGSDSSSSSNATKIPVDPCDEAMDKALEAAHNVEVGDYYFGLKNYKAASFRYEDAVKQKPQDAAIHVRLGRVHEKLKEVPQAVEEYSTAEKLSGPAKWAQEARESRARLERQTPGSK